jgi:hypothetical protein
MQQSTAAPTAPPTMAIVLSTLGGSGGGEVLSEGASAKDVVVVARIVVGVSDAVGLIDEAKVEETMVVLTAVDVEVDSAELKAPLVVVSVLVVELVVLVAVDVDDGNVPRVADDIVDAAHLCESVVLVQPDAVRFWQHSGRQPIKQFLSTKLES